jgi:nitrite reductase/ring-hydroxylating ferredoxin subunit
VYACQATCPHKGLPLCDAHFDGGVLTCLEHLWQWDLREGGAPRGPARAPLTVYAVAVHGLEVHLCDHGSGSTPQTPSVALQSDCDLNR